MAGYKANTNPKTEHTRKMYHDQEVRVSILYKENGSKVKCGCVRGIKKELWKYIQVNVT